MNSSQEEKYTSSTEEQTAAQPQEIAARQATKPAARETSSVVARSLRMASFDAHLHRSTMSALPATLIGLGILTLFVGSLAAWMIFVPITAVVSAPAELVFKSKRQTVQHLEGGIVEKILVKDGDLVQAGQALIVLEDKQVQPIVRMVQEQNIAEKAQMSRLEAESKGLNSLDSTIKGGGNKYIQTENRLFKARQETYQNQIELMRIQIAQAKESLNGLQARLALKNQEIASIKEQLTANQDLARDGYVTRTVILDQQRVLAANSGEREAMIASIASDKQRIAELEQRIIALKADRVQGAVSELKQSAMRRIDQEERIRPLKDTLERQVIRAPVTGRVVGLKVSTVGGTIMPRETLMEIAPAGEALILEAKIDMKDINEVKIGQGADVSISSFDGRKTLPFRAKVTYISADRIMPSSSQAKPYYAAHLEFEPDSLKDHSADKLLPGMSATVSIAIAPRTALDYMIDPMRDKARKALQTR